MIRRLSLAFFLFFIMGLNPALAKAVLSSAQQVWVSKIEQNLTQIQSFQARFRQTSPKGEGSSGTVILVRPGRVRFNYDAPSPLLLVANQGKVVFQDRSIDQITTLPLKRTPLGLLLRPDPHLTGDVTITSFHEIKGQIQLRVVRTAAPQEGELTLYFSKTPLALLGWSVLDAQGASTHIQLSDIQTGINVDPQIFTLPKAE
ncbi:LolA family protein [Aristophania vespae]|uniref:LolA family protein n=1 Tax=Aristophania vespae TaxID=2697033 RepID=UPI0023513665|nr:outer membrane lipoprotein carrier protein LolA [Aristophania vespae]UMM63319.1 Outer-membrane lipoprotein carrier protein [Aristophania vespae]